MFFFPGYSNFLFKTSRQGENLCSLLSIHKYSNEMYVFTFDRQFEILVVVGLKGYYGQKPRFKDFSELTFFLPRGDFIQSTKTPIMSVCMAQ